MSEKKQDAGAPERIYLQTGCDDEECEGCFDEAMKHGEVTWCEDKIYESDVAYTRADLAIPREVHDAAEQVRFVLNQRCERAEKKAHALRERVEALATKWLDEAKSMDSRKSMTAQTLAQGMSRCAEELRAALDALEEEK